LAACRRTWAGSSRPRRPPECSGATSVKKLAGVHAGFTFWDYSEIENNSQGQARYPYSKSAFISGKLSTRRIRVEFPGDYRLFVTVISLFGIFRSVLLSKMGTRPLLDFSYQPIK
jgi:hypothetical protein